LALDRTAADVIPDSGARLWGTRAARCRDEIAEGAPPMRTRPRWRGARTALSLLTSALVVAACASGPAPSDNTRPSLSDVMPSPAAAAAQTTAASATHS